MAWISALLCLFYFYTGAVAYVHCPMSFTCNATEIPSGFVGHFCSERNGTMLDRCCILNQQSSTLIGLDLRNCGLSVLNITDIPHDKVEIMDLRENELDKVTTNEFLGFMNLNTLFLPFNSDCPGGQRAWEHVYRNPNDSFTECSSQLSTCRYLNVSCTLNGLCIQEGPGSAKCICKPNHHGYKCLQQGTFPMLTFVLCMVIPTLLTSGVSWLYLRRNVGLGDKHE